MSTIEIRLLLLLTAESGDSVDPDDHDDTSTELSGWPKPSFAVRGFWKWLGEVSGVSSPRWRAFFAGRQKPTPSMIEAACRIWPHYAFWIATGITDAANGHIAPPSAITFPERLYAEDEASNKYFRASINLNLKLYEAFDPTASSTDAAQATKRVQLFGRWTGGKLTDVAYALANSEAYQQLVRLWESREADRPNNVARLVGTNRPWITSEGIDRSSRPDGLSMTHQSAWDLFYKKDTS